MTSPFRLLLSAVLLGAALSSFALALMLVSLLSRFAKDLDEVFWTWRYVETFVLAGCLMLAGWWLTRKGSKGVTI